MTQNSMAALATDDPVLAANDLVMAKQMAECLHKHYPGHLWAVQVQGAQGVADVRNLALSGNWGFRIRLGQVYSASQFEQLVMRAGGELLERYRISRSNSTTALDQILSAPKNFAGNLIADK